MRYLKIIFLFLIFPVFGQQNIEASFISKEKSNVENFVGIDNFGDSIFVKDNAILVERKLGSVEFAEIQLGKISSADVFNPLKMNVFYKDFNTVIILDNRLNVIYRIEFNDYQPYRNVTHISTGNDNTIWIYNQDSQQLEVFDYKQRISRVRTLPITSNVLAIESNYNSVWILTKDHLISYNYFGSMISKIENEGYTSLKEVNENIILKKENELYYLSEDSDKIILIDLPELLIKAFFATDETLYIYDGEFLHQYKLKIT